MAAYMMCVLTTITGCPGESDDRAKELKQLVSSIESHKWGDKAYSTGNSQNSGVTINTPVIDRLIEIGLPAIPHLIAEMEKKDISFNRFIHCYSACDQIFSDCEPPRRVLWYGGSDFDDDAEDTKFKPFGQGDLKMFYAKVVADIRSNYKDVTEKD